MNLDFRDHCQDPNGCQHNCQSRCLFLDIISAKPSSRNGSPEFYKILEESAEIHHKKSHDYASNNDPFANYKFAGMISKLFNNPDDSGFIGRIGEKLYRLANLENNAKDAVNESIEDTEKDIVTITALWVAMRRERRKASIKGIDYF